MASDERRDEEDDRRNALDDRLDGEGLPGSPDDGSGLEKADRRDTTDGMDVEQAVRKLTAETEDGDETDEEITFEVEPLDTPIEKGAIDPENALFVVLGMVLTILVVVRFLSILP